MSDRSVLFVCLGNICRSPTAEGIFRYQLAQAGLTDRISVDSAGTGNWHVGNPPDPRARAAAKQHGYDLSSLTARQTVAEDFQRFDYLVAMDRSNRQNLRVLANAVSGIPVTQAQDKIHLMLSFHGQTTLSEVPDPYYGGDNGFDQVIELIEHACDGLLESLQQELATS